MFKCAQDYEDYTPINQAVWRYVMRKNVDYLSKVAHDSYLEGLRKTGIDKVLIFSTPQKQIFHTLCKMINSPDTLERDVKPVQHEVLGYFLWVPHAFEGSHVLA